MLIITLYFFSIYPFDLVNLIDLSSVGEVLCSRFRLAVSPPSDRRGRGTYSIVTTKDKTMGFIHID